MRYTVSDIVKAVRVILDQNQAENSIISSEDNTLELDAIIKQKILHAARHLLETSDVSLIDYGKVLTGTLTEIGEVGVLSIYKLPCPSDYLRLLSLQMSDWKRAVHVTIPQNSAEYSELQSGFIGITGNPERPAVAECVGWDSTNSTDTRWLEIYTSEAGSLMAGKNRYCPAPPAKPEDFEKATVGGVANTEVFDFPERLYRMLLYQTGALVAATYKDTALAQSLMNMVYEGEPEDKTEQ